MWHPVPLNTKAAPSASLPTLLTLMQFKAGILRQSTCGDMDLCKLRLRNDGMRGSFSEVSEPRPDLDKGRVGIRSGGELALRKY